MFGSLVLISLMGLSFGDNLFDYELYQDVLDPELCDRQLEAIGQFEFYDASFRVPQGLLEGNLASLGNYHQCLAIHQDFPGNNIEGKYCLIQARISPPVIRIPILGGASSTENVTWTEVMLNLKIDERKADGLYREIEAAGIGARTDELNSAIWQSLALSLAVCVPRTCTVDAALAPFTENPLIGFNYTEQYCRLPGDKPFVGADYAITIIFTFIGILTIISTAYELRHTFILKRDPKEANELFCACSVYSNTGKLLSFADSPRSLDCIDGVRSLSILWIIIGHTFSVYLSNYVVNDLELVEGLLEGNLASLGNYHQCLAIHQDFPGNNIEGKYCLIQARISPPVIRIPILGGASSTENVTWTEVMLNLKIDERKADGLYREIEAAGIGARTDELNSAIWQSLALSLAVCVPRTCTVDAALAPFTENPLIGFNYTEQYCRLPGDKPFVGADYAITIIFTFIGILTIISTAYELRHTFILKRDPKEANELFCACSVYSNTGKLLSFADSPRSLDCIDGVRSLSILWIIIGHTFSVYLSNYVVNDLELVEWSFQRRALWIMSANVGVDTFFTLSGLLLVYTSAKKMRRMTLLKNLHMFYLNRVLRIFPLLAAAVLVQASVMHRVSDGPSWHYMAYQVDLCRRYWWSALLHVQNIVNSRERCLPHSWYLSVDMQLHIVSPLVLFWVLGSRRAAWSSLATGIIASLAGTLAFCFIYNFPASPMALTATAVGIRDYIVFYYHNTVTRSPPFFIGMMCGYILHVFRGQKIKLSNWTIAFCYILAVLLSFYAFYIVYPSLSADWDNQTATNFNNSFRRACWSVALCWMIIACVHGYGGPVNWFLSLKLWKFVARISYAMYLFHYLVQFGTASTAVAPIYFNIETVFTLFANDLVYTVALSVAACVLIDAPMATLQKILLGGNSKSQKPKEELEIRCEPDAEAAA